MLLCWQLHSLLPLLTLFQCFLAPTKLACLVMRSSTSCFRLLSAIRVRSTKVKGLPDQLDFGCLGNVSTILSRRHLESSPPDSSRTASIGLALLLSIQVLRVSLNRNEKEKLLTLHLHHVRASSIAYWPRQPHNSALLQRHYYDLF